MASGAEAVEPVESLAEVIPLFQGDRSCFTCSHWRGIELGSVSWCEVYEQVVDDEAYDAEDCFTYERCEEGSQPVLDQDPRED